MQKSDSKLINRYILIFENKFIDVDYLYSKQFHIYFDPNITPGFIVINVFFLCFQKSNYSILNCILPLGFDNNLARIFVSLPSSLL